MVVPSAVPAVTGVGLLLTPEDVRVPSLTPQQAADFLRVDPKTIVRWANSGQLTLFRSQGSHRRIRRDEAIQLKLEREKGV